MTCGFCRYEFCWACQGSAGPEDNHFNGNGCGVAQMDENVRPGDGVDPLSQPRPEESQREQTQCCHRYRTPQYRRNCKIKCKFVWLRILAVLVFILLMPLSITIFAPLYFAFACTHEKVIRRFRYGHCCFNCGRCFKTISCCFSWWILGLIFLPGWVVLALFIMPGVAIYQCFKWYREGARIPGIVNPRPRADA